MMGTMWIMTLVVMRTIGMGIEAVAFGVPGE